MRGKGGIGRCGDTREWGGERGSHRVAISVVLDVSKLEKKGTDEDARCDP